MRKVAVIAVEEPVHIDANRVGDIVDELGEHAAQNVIGLALEQIASGLKVVEAAFTDDDLAQVSDRAARLARLAWQVGLVTLSGIAIDVVACCSLRDRPALAATVARLLRVGNRSVTQIWDSTEWD